MFLQDPLSMIWKSSSALSLAEGVSTGWPSSSYRTVPATHILGSFKVGMQTKHKDIPSLTCLDSFNAVECFNNIRHFVEVYFTVVVQVIKTKSPFQFFLICREKIISWKIKISFPVSLFAMSIAIRNSLKSRKSFPSESKILKIWFVILVEFPADRKTLISLYRVVI